MENTGHLDSYCTLASSGEAKLKEKGSVFIAMAVPIASAEEADTVLNGWRKQYYDATHIGWARRIGPPQKVQERADDDGEPHGSTGPPILNAIKGADLFDVLVGVVRYYGGTKLGVGGLIRAYGGAAADAVLEAPRKTIWVTSVVEVHVPHERAGAVYALADKREAKVAAPEYETSGLKLELTILSSRAQGLADDIREMTAGRAEVTIHE